MEINQTLLKAYQNWKEFCDSRDRSKLPEINKNGNPCDECPLGHQSAGYNIVNMCCEFISFEKELENMVKEQREEIEELEEEIRERKMRLERLKTTDC